MHSAVQDVMVGRTGHWVHPPHLKPHLDGFWLVLLTPNKKNSKQQPTVLQFLPGTTCLGNYGKWRIVTSKNQHCPQMRRVSLYISKILILGTNQADLTYQYLE